MRILVLSFYYAPDLSAGSFRTTAFIEELKAQLKEDDTVEIISSMPNRYESFNKEAKEFEKLSENISITRVSLGTHKSGFIDQSKLFVKFALNVIWLVLKREKYDIVYATSSKLMTAFLASIISNRQKAKLYLDIRDIFTDTLKSIFSNKKLKYIIPMFNIIEKYTIKSATHINLVSKGFENYFKNINNNISYSFYTNAIDELFLNYDFTANKKHNKKVITYTGNIGEGQGLEKIVPNIAKILGEDYEINIIGDGGRKKALIESLDGINNVKIFNPISRIELLEVYKNSDILFLHLNDYKAFEKVLPSKLFEYAVTNKFIVAGVNGYAKEFIEEFISNVVVFEPCNADDFYEKFKKIDLSKKIDREDFVKNFKRKNIMSKLAKEVYELHTNRYFV